MKAARLGYLGLLLFAIVFGSTLARADAIYSYVGPNFTAASGDYFPASPHHVSGSFTVPAPLTNCSPCDLLSSPPPGFNWSFSDTLNTLTAGHPGDFLNSFELTTDAEGIIETWVISMDGAGPFPNPDCHADRDCFVATQNQIPNAFNVVDIGQYSQAFPTGTFAFSGETSVSTSPVTGVWSCTIVEAATNSRPCAATSNVDEPSALPLLIAAALAAGISGLRSAVWRPRRIRIA